MFRPLGFSRAGKHLVEQIRAMPDGTPVEDYARDSAAALARYMSRCNDYGQDILARDLAEASALVGHRLDDKDEAQAAVQAYVRPASPQEDGRLAQHFHNLLLRQEFLLRDCGQASFLVGVDTQPDRQSVVWGKIE